MHHDDHRFEQATQWLLKLKEHPEPPVFEQWKAWLHESDENQKAFEECILLDSKLGAIEPHRAERLIRLATQRASNNSTFAKPLALAASVFAIAITLFMLHQGAGDTYTTAIGESKNIILSDGSELFLDSDSRIKVLMKNTERQVQLLQGQVMFNVAPAPACPFTVKIDEFMVQVLGTKFNINKLADEMVVSVAHGKVKVSDPTSPDVYLTANQMYNTENDKLSQRKSDQFANWQSGKIVFNNSSLENAILQINRYSEKPLKLSEPHSTALKLSGTYNIADAQQFAALLPKVLPVNIIDKNTYWSITAQ
ncbi:FecR family protein [Pseudoalteromonas piscicida]|uniref:FecR protein domain-containing protein n=1 Tax=Pseudoalteromonas piscicida TaxID=43662 RepID=A0A2A5JWG8_PSEO7|nr:FecR domain-containing protein [Pseudoalteromonas piscicida]PCK33689.1 hypothetical protein CEX98_00755 [Pseudoalteromonas piscicida]